MNIVCFSLPSLRLATIPIFMHRQGMFVFFLHAKKRIRIQTAPAVVDAEVRGGFFCWIQFVKLGKQVKRPH